VLEAMPSLVGLTNLQYAAVLTYVRNDWGNSAPAVFPEDVRAVLKANAGRTTPWTEDALLEIPEGP
jgi:mono/diheme cytochrome c family protein